MARKRLKSAERRAQILGVALELFARRGYGSTTTAAIAEAADITEPVLYRHFQNKRDLFYRLVESVSEATLERWEGILDEARSPRQQILKLARGLPALLDDLRLGNLVLLRASADADEDDELREIVLEHYKKYVSFLEAIVRRGMAEGEFRKGLNVRQAAWQLMGPGLAFASTQGLGLDPKVKSRVLRQSIEALLESWA